MKNYCVDKNYTKFQQNLITLNLIQRRDFNKIKNKSGEFKISTVELLVENGNGSDGITNTKVSCNFDEKLVPKTKLDQFHQNSLA